MEATTTKTPPPETYKNWLDKREKVILLAKNEMWIVNKPTKNSIFVYTISNIAHMDYQNEKNVCPIQLTKCWSDRRN